MKMKFGTDGWRAIIGDTFTYENVRKLMQAFCDLNSKNKPAKIFLGYDRRFSSRPFAEAAAEVLLGNGFEVHLASGFCPTPCISWMTKKFHGLAGVMITASHNPYLWNGVKFKEGYGGSASPAYTTRLEGQWDKNEKSQRQPKLLSLEEGRRQRKLKYFDPYEAYLKQIEGFIDVASIRGSGVKILADVMHGAGAGFFKRILGDQAIEIRDEENPCFGGVNPEPIEKNLHLTTDLIKKYRVDLALATDGDADRIGAMDERGNFISSQEIFALILRHLIHVRGWKGDVVKTVSATQLIDRMGETYGFKVHETPIGFKYICQEFLKTKPLMGGEESGGIGIAKHVYERDGIVSGLLLLEVLAYHRKPISKILQDLQKEFGPLDYLREDLPLKIEQIANLQKNLSQGMQPRTSLGPVHRVNRLDGFKFQWQDGSWLLIRLSGTEPLLRIYAESTSEDKTQELIRAGKKIITRSK